VDVLADERGAPAVRAVVASRFAGPHALAQELALEVGLGDAQERLQHGLDVRRTRRISYLRAPLAPRLRPLVAAALTLAR
jgi:hypothetical protein